MRISNITLASIFTVLLVAGSVQSSKRKDQPTSTGSEESAVQKKFETRGEVTGEQQEASQVTSISPSTSKSVVKKSSIADSYRAHRFIDAVRRGDLRTANEIFEKEDEEHKRYYGEYLVSLGRNRLVELIKGGRNYLIMGVFLGILFLSAEKEFIEEIIKGVDLSSNHLAWVAHNIDLACKPNKFINFLQRISEGFYQKIAVGTGITVLFDANKIGCVKPLVDAIESEPSLSQDVKHYAIKTVFERAPYYPFGESASFAKQYHDHPAIIAEDYSDVLDRSYLRGGPKRELFYWLLARADREDLEAVKINWRFSRQPQAFQDAVSYVLSTLSPDAETRHQRWLRRRKAAIDDATGMSLPTEVLSIVTEYGIY